MTKTKQLAELGDVVRFGSSRDTHGVEEGVVVRVVRCMDYRVDRTAQVMREGVPTLVAVPEFDYEVIGAGDVETARQAMEDSLRIYPVWAERFANGQPYSYEVV